MRRQSNALDTVLSYLRSRPISDATLADEIVAEAGAVVLAEGGLGPDWP